MSSISTLAQIIPIREVQRKACAKCGEVRDITDFYTAFPGKGDKLNKHSYCKLCERQRRKDYSFRKSIEKYGLEEATKRTLKRTERKDKKKSAAPGNKVCSYCWEEKKVSEFNTHPNVKDGYHSFCKLCNSELNKKYKSKSPIARLSVSMSTAKQSSKRKNLAFELNPELLVKLWEKQKGLCYYTNVPMKFDGSGGTESVSIDRIDSSEGYIESNIVLCCTYINRMKNDQSTQEFIRWCSLVVNHQGNQ